MNKQARKLVGKLAFMLAMGATMYWAMADDATNSVDGLIAAQERRMVLVTPTSRVAEVDDDGNEIPSSALPLSSETKRIIMAYARCHRKDYRAAHLDDCLEVKL